jgi:hypothetical protein
VCGPPRPSWSGHWMRSISSWMLPRLPMICNRFGRYEKVPVNYWSSAVHTAP